MAETSAELYRRAGEAYNEGHYAVALELYRQLADEGWSNVLVFLARMYAEGHGTAVDLDEAGRLLDRAASLGVREAVLQRAAVFHKRGDMRGYFDAVRRASDLGLLPASYLLGLCYACGRGVAVDERKAAMIMAEAAARGHVWARIFLGQRLMRNPWNPIQFLGGVWRFVSGFALVAKYGILNPQDDRYR